LILFLPTTPRDKRTDTVTADQIKLLMQQASLDGEVVADVLKFSGVRGLTVIVEGELPGADEDCGDFNYLCDDVRLYVLDGCRPKGSYGFTVKGGSNAIHIETAFLSLAKVCEVDLGNHSDQSQRPTTNVMVIAKPPAGKRLRYRQLNATDPLLGPQKWRCKFRLWSWLRRPFAATYALLKKIGLPI